IAVATAISGLAAVAATVRNWRHGYVLAD
ncbi:MAG: hypothetical protein K0Q64_966, partial [Nitrobacter vulgaris]|nr:hypothetical protein [Nitrobacter vulgaris]